MLQRQLFRLGSAIVLSGMLSCAHAVELGEPMVRSHIGQPLLADIELTGIAGDAASVQAALADPDVYRGASISLHPALSTLNITIVRRGGKRFLHLASAKAVDTEYVHLFFTLTENGRAAVRQATLWLTPDPNPAPPPAAPAPPPAAPAPPAPVVVAAPIAAAARPPVAAPIAAVVRPAVAAPTLRAAPAAQPVACAPRFSAAQISACAAIDSKNAALSARIVELEDKVKVLTLAMRATVEAPASARPLIKPVPPKAAPTKPAAVPPAGPVGSTPWRFIGIASALVFALAAVLLYIRQRKRRRAKPAKAKPAAKPAAGFIASVRDRLLPAKKAIEQPVAAE